MHLVPCVSTIKICQATLLYLWKYILLNKVYAWKDSLDQWNHHNCSISCRHNSYLYFHYEFHKIGIKEITSIYRITDYIIMYCSLYCLYNMQVGKEVSKLTPSLIYILRCTFMEVFSSLLVNKLIYLWQLYWSQYLKIIQLWISPILAYVLTRHHKITR